MALRSVKAVGRLGIIQNDMSDPDDEPDILYCDTGQVQLESLASETRYLGDDPMASLLGQSVITGNVDSQGFITWNGLRYVKIPDLSSEELNPHIPVGATHEIKFVNCRVGGTGPESRPVNFTSRKIRIAQDTVDEATGVCNLIKQMPVPDLGGVPIVQGPPGRGIAQLAVEGNTLLATLNDEAGTVLSADLPAAMVDSDEFVGDRIGTDGTAAEAAVSERVAAGLVSATGHVYARHPAFGVKADGATDDTAALQAFVNYITVNGRIGVLPAGTIKISSTINFPRRPGWQLRGAGLEKTVISQATENIPIFDLGATSGTQVHSVLLSDMRFTYANVQPATNTNANPIVHSQEVYWATFERLAFMRGHYAFKVKSGVGGPWGSIWNDIRCGPEMTGGVMDWSQCINGVPNNHFGRIFLDGSNMVGPIFWVRGYNFTIDTIEFAAIHQSAQLLVLDPSTRVEIGTIKLENGTYGPAAAGKALVEARGNAYANIGHFHIGGNNLTVNLPGDGRLFALQVNAGVGANGFIRVEFIDAILTSVLGVAFIAATSSAARGIEIGGAALTNWSLCDSSLTTAQNRVRLLSAMNGQVSLDRGDANVTLAIGSETVQMFNTPLTAPRTVTLPPSGAAFNGLEFHIVSKGAVNGANTITVKDGSTTIATVTADNQTARIGFRRSTSREWIAIPR